ncbi:MAG: YCF48-related protein, partial [Myxococcota bacterium]
TALLQLLAADTITIQAPIRNEDENLTLALVFVANDNFLMVDIPDLKGVAYGQDEAGEQNSRENPNFQLGDLVIQDSIDTGATGGPMIFGGVNVVIEDGVTLDSGGGNIVLVGVNPVTDAEQQEPPGTISVAGSIETHGGEASLRSDDTIELSGGLLETDGGKARFYAPTLNLSAPVDTGGGSLSSLESTQITVSSNLQTQGGPVSFSTAGGDIDLQAALITEGGSVTLNSSATEDSEGTSVGGTITLSGPGTLIDTQLTAGEEVTDDDVGGSITLTADSDITVDGGIRSGGSAIQIVGLGRFDSTAGIDAVRATKGTQDQFIAGALDLKVAQDASIGGDLSAQTLNLGAGSANDGTLNFEGSPVLRSVQSELDENTTDIQGIQLQAGIGSGTQASVNDLAEGPRFEGGAPTDNPVRFAVIQDADMTDDTLPSPDQFGAGHVADLNYQLQSIGTDTSDGSTSPQTSGFITLTDKQKFDGAQLQLGTGTGASFESGQEFDLKSLILAVETSFEIDSALAGAILAEDIGIISGSDLEIADSVVLSAGDGASGSMALAAGASGGGDLTFGANVRLVADEIALAAGLASGGNSQVALATGTGATEFQRNTDSDLNDHSFSITQDAAIEDSMLPEANAFLDASGGAAGSIDGMNYTLLSQGGEVTIETPSKVANTNLSLVGLKGVEIASTITVQSLTAGSTRSFEVTEDLVDQIQFSDPSQGSLAFQAGSSGQGNLSFGHSQDGAGITIAAETIELYAGGPSSSSTSWIVFDDDHLPTFIGSAGPQTSPREFFFRQSETIADEDLPAAARFGDGIGPTELFAIQSDGKSIQLSTPDSVAGSTATRLVTSATTVSFSASDENLDMNTRPVEIQATNITLSASATTPEAGSTEPLETFIVDASGIDQLSGFQSGSFDPDSPPDTLPTVVTIQQSGRIVGSQLPSRNSWQGDDGPDGVFYTLNSTEAGIDLSADDDAALVQGSQLVVQVNSADHDIDLGSGFSLQSLDARAAGEYTVNAGTEVEAEDFIVLTAGCARSDVSSLCSGQGNLVLKENITLRAPIINLQAGRELDLRSLELASTDFVDESSGWAVGSSGAVLHTSDGGVSWLIQDSPVATNLRDVKFINADEGWAVGDEGVILQTLDGGDAWSELASGTTKELSGVTFVNSDEGWAVGAAGTILTTADGGENWSTQQSGTSHALAATTFTSNTQGWAVGNSGTILATSDGGLTWTKQQSGTGQDLVDVTFATTTTGWAVGTTGTILTTSDGGTTWSSQDGAVTSTLASLSFVDEEAGWIVGGTDPDLGIATILDTTDAGATWGLQGSGTTHGLSGVDFVDGQSGWAVGEAGTILHTADGGDDWEPQGIGGIVQIAPDPSIRFELVPASDNSETFFNITQNGDAISANLPIASQFGGNGSQSLSEVGNYALLVLGGTARITEIENLRAANLQIGAPAIVISGESLGEDELENTLLQAQSVTLEATGATGQVLADVDTLLIWGQTGLSNPNSFSLIQNPTVEPSDTAQNLPDLSQFAQPINGMTYSVTSKTGDVIVNFPDFSPRVVSSSLRLQAGENRSVIVQTTLSVNSLYVNADPSVANTNLILSAAPETTGQITIPTVSSITDQYYASPVVLAEDAELQAGGSIVFTSTINAQAEGEQSLKTGAGAGIQFGAD